MHRELFANTSVAQKKIIEIQADTASNSSASNRPLRSDLAIKPQIILACINREYFLH